MNCKFIQINDDRYINIDHVAEIEKDSTKNNCYNITHNIEMVKTQTYGGIAISGFSKDTFCNNSIENFIKNCITKN